MFLKIAHSFAAKLNLYILSFLIALFIAGFGTFYHVASQYIEKQTYQKISTQADEINFRVSRLMRTIEKIPENLGRLLPTYVTHPDSIFSITRQVVKNNSEVFGCAIAFEPNYFPSKGAHFAPYSYMKGDSVVTTLIGNNYDYYQKNWYKLSKERNQSRWTRPYHELSSANIITSTYSVPLRDSKDQIIGIFSVDLSLNWLTELIDSIKPYPDSYIIIINREGRFILHHQDSLQTGLEDNIFNQAYQMPDTSIIGISKRIANGEKGKATFFDHNDKSYIFYSPVIGTEWCMATICPYKHVYEGLNRFNLIISLLFVCFLILVCLICTLTVRRITKPLKNFALTTASIAEGNFNTPLPPIRSKDEMQELYSAFSEMQKRLANYMHNLEKTTAVKEKMESELRIAHDIQMSMLPKDFPPFPEHSNIDFYAIIHPARQVGGDFYDFFISGDDLYFAIGDVSGKGIPASLLMSYTISLLRSFSSKPASSSEIARFLNNRITERNEADMFVTFFIGILNLKTGKLKYCNAGHMPPVITYPDRTSSFFDIHAELPLGILKDYPYQEYTYTFSSGSGILLYTDGVTEAENAKGAFYTKERLLQIIHQNRAQHPREFLQRIITDIQSHVQTYEQSDDLTLFTLIYGEEWNLPEKKES